MALHGHRRSGPGHAHIPENFPCTTALGVLAMGLSLGIELGQCGEALKTAHGVRGRVEVVPTDGDYTFSLICPHAGRSGKTCCAPCRR